ncbi:hypothetical protein [Burkholderia latens]|uniref:hypothetical protein n=1 Tax=Burkholderia latens TaxID=488446 RepID=UPI001AE3D9DB|nr:hypothetical protein [Burkholderia latens]QTO49434.1 hypothetical protein J8I86_05740 [Burkholderia latens]
MAKKVYFVTALSGADKVAEKLKEVASEDETYRLAADKWFVTFEGISQQLAEKLGIRGDPHVGTGLVFPVSSYSGRAPTTLWEWLKLKME